MWDTKVAEWLKRTQAAAEKQASKSRGEPSAAASAKPSKLPKLSKAEQKHLGKLKADVTELEDYIPWQAVSAAWGNRRNAWARRVRECPDANAVAKQVNLLEQALVGHALLPDWRSEAREEWSEELLAETSAEKVRASAAGCGRARARRARRPAAAPPPPCARPEDAC